MGIHNDTTRRKLLQTRQLTLAVAVDICRASELASRQLKAMAGADAVERVDTKSKFQRDFRGRSPSRTRPDAPRRQHSATRQTGNNTDRNRKCKFCLRSHEFVKSACFAWQKTCNDCGKKNHFSGSSVCHKQSRTSDVRSVDEELLAVVGKNKNRKYTTLLVNGHRSKLLLDSESTINLLPTEFAVKIGLKQLIRPAESILRMFDQQKLRTDGIVTCQVQFPNSSKVILADFYLTKSHREALLGIDSSLELGLIQFDENNICSVQAGLNAEKIARKYSELFEGYGKLEGKVHLDIDPTVTPVRLPLRRIPIHIRDKVKMELDKLEQNGIIAKVDEPVEWTSALCVVNKPHSDAVRIVIDPKPLNRALKRSHFLFKTLDDVLSDLNQAKVYSVLDASNAFFSVELDYESSLLCAFETPYGIYRWERLPQGISVAPEIYARKIHQAMGGLENLIIIADDFVIYGKGDTYEAALADHNKQLEAFLNRCRERGVKLNRSKM